MISKKLDAQHEPQVYALSLSLHQLRQQPASCTDMLSWNDYHALRTKRLDLHSSDELKKSEQYFMWGSRNGSCLELFINYHCIISPLYKCPLLVKPVGGMELEDEWMVKASLIMFWIPTLHSKNEWDVHVGRAAPTLRAEL